ncbi:MAG: hypothetical protein ACE5NG_05415, partial [bacterium]
EQSIAIISTSGELKDQTQFPGGVAYIWTHTIFDDAIEKSVRLRYHGRKPQVKIIEPIVQQSGMNFQLVDSQGQNRQFRFEIVEGNVQIELGKDESQYWFPFPSIKCYPITLILQPAQEQFIQKIRYRISILN